MHSDVKVRFNRASTTSYTKISKNTGKKKESVRSKASYSRQKSKTTKHSKKIKEYEKKSYSGILESPEEYLQEPADDQTNEIPLAISEDPLRHDEI